MANIDINKLDKILSSLNFTRPFNDTWAYKLDSNGKISVEINKNGFIGIILIDHLGEGEYLSTSRSIEELIRNLSGMFIIPEEVLKFFGFKKAGDEWILLSTHSISVKADRNGWKINVHTYDGGTLVAKAKSIDEVICFVNMI